MRELTNSRALEARVLVVAALKKRMTGRMMYTTTSDSRKQFLASRRQAKVMSGEWMSLSLGTWSWFCAVEPERE